MTRAPLRVAVGAAGTVLKLHGSRGRTNRLFSEGHAWQTWDLLFVCQVPASHHPVQSTDSHTKSSSCAIQVAIVERNRFRWPPSALPSVHHTCARTLNVERHRFKPDHIRRYSNDDV